MDASFAFPPHQPPVPRARTGGGSNGPRESNALRASVLDAALQLGLTNNSLVAEWMFNNTVREEDEEESLQSPGLTHSSSATSDEYSSWVKVPTTPPNTYALPPAAAAASFGINGKPVAAWNSTKGDVDMPYLQNDPSLSSGNQVIFPSSSSSQDISVPSRPVTPNSSKKLKKKKNDDYESDGGYLSEGVKKKKGGFGDLMKKDKAQLKEEKRQLKELKEEERKRKKSLGAAAKASKKQQQQQEEGGGGYETDSSPILKSPFKSKSKKNKSKTPSGDVGDETDGGYQSAGSNLKKNKTRFFKLGSKSSKGDLREPVPAVPEHPPELPMPLPIAEKFATSLPTLSTPPSSSSGNLNVQTDSTKPSVPSSISSAGTARPSDPHSPPRSPEQQPSSAKQSPIKDYLGLDIETTIATTTLAATSSPTTANVQDRSSLSSAETSSSSVMSSNSRRRGFQFSPSRDNSSISTGHTAGESVSTVNSSTFSHPSAPILPPSQPAAAAPPTSFPSISYSPPSSSSGASLKPPSISLPLTRSPSPMTNLPAVAPLQIAKPPRARPDGVDSRGPSPLPVSPSSPYPSTTPTATSPNFGGGAAPTSGGIGVQPFSAASSSSAATSATTSRPTTPRRPVNPPTDGFGPRPANLASPPAVGVSGRLSPNPGSGRLSPNPARGRLISPLLLPQANANGERDPSPLPSPNVLAYYDIPPPSPPPQGPLPSVPPVPPATQIQGSQLRNKMLMLDGARDREREREIEMLGVPQSHIQRGRESPFPTRPLAVPNSNPMVVSLPSSPHPHHNPHSQSHLPLRLQQQHGQGRGGPGRSVRFNEHTYEYSSGSNSGNSSREASPEYGYSTLPPRERAPGMYAYSAGSPPPQHLPRNPGISPLPHAQPSSQDWNDNNRFSTSGSAEGLAYDMPSQEDEPVGNVRGVRFAPGLRDEDEDDAFTQETSSSSDHFHAPPARPRPRPRRRSFDSGVGAPGAGTGVERETIYQWEDDLSKNRESRWSGSIYSRVSIMDPDQSEEARERFVKRVQAMMQTREDGEGDGQVIPPVPRIPEGLANAGSLNKF